MIPIIEELQKFSSKLKATQQEQDKVQQAMISRFMGVKFVNSINKAKNLGELSQTMLGLNKASLIADSPELMNIVNSLANIKQAELTFGKNEEIFKQKNKLTEQLVGDTTIDEPTADGKFVSKKFSESDMFKNIQGLDPSIISDALLSAANQLGQKTAYVSDPYAKDNVITRKYTLRRDGSREEISRLILKGGKVYDELKNTEVPETMIPPEYYTAMSERNKVKRAERFQSPQYQWTDVVAYMKDDPDKKVILSQRGSQSGKKEFIDPISGKPIPNESISSVYTSKLYNFFKDELNQTQDPTKLEARQKSIASKIYMLRNDPNVLKINTEIAEELFPAGKKYYDAEGKEMNDITPEQKLSQAMDNPSLGRNLNRREYAQALYKVAKKHNIADLIVMDDEGISLEDYWKLYKEYELKTKKEAEKSPQGFTNPLYLKYLELAKQKDPNLKNIQNTERVFKVKIKTN